MDKPMLTVYESTTQESVKKNQYIATLCVCLGAVCAGTALAWTSPVLPQIQIQPETARTNSSILNLTESAITSTITPILINASNGDGANSTQRFQLTESQGSLVGSMLAIGAFCSAIPAGFLADKYGRKKANLMLAVPYVINWAFLVFAVNPFMLYVGRLFSGIATGAMCVTAPMYIGEIAEISIRGTLGSFFQMCLCFGIFLTYLVGAKLTWVGLSWVLMIIPVLFAICLYFMPDTPVYLMKIGDRKGAEESLRFFRGPNYDVRHELRSIQNDIDKAAEQAGNFSDIFKSKGNRKALFSALGLMMCQQLSGINAVIFYTVPIFKSAGSDLSPSIAAIIVAIVQLIIAYVAAMVIDKAPRRVYLMCSITGSSVCLLVLAMYFHMTKNGIYFTGIGILPLASLVLFIVAFSMGLGPVPWMIMGELFAPEIKGVASGLTVMCNWSLVFFVTFLFPIANSSLGGHVTFYFFAIVMVIGDIFIYTYIPETKGRSVQEIQAILRK